MKNNNKISDYVKANRKGSRDASLENNSGFVSVKKIHKSLKKYNRKSKHNKKYESE